MNLPENKNVEDKKNTIKPNIGERLYKKRKVKKVKEKTDWVAWFAGFISVIVILGIIAAGIGTTILLKMLEDRPELDILDFNNSESSIVYDRNGNVIAELGVTIRENVSYEDLPNNVIDAFVAVEDSRFFEHNGFDLPRFTKAILENVKSLSFSQGGSTFTMQLVKNTYFTNDATGENASRSGMSGVKRKVQEIALAIELEKNLSKEKILELYLNKLNFGGGSRNIRGIEKASLYYFGKSVSEVNLPEAAFLAGVVNAPNAYNPYYHLDAATKRRNNVLYLMYQHGYISDVEYQLALNTKLEDSLVPESGSVGGNKGSGNGVQYQAFIDVVIAEVYDKTGLDPYTTTMKIYTSMDPIVQRTMDNIQKGNIDAFEYPNDTLEVASIAIDNKTGEIVGVLGGRNYADGGALLLNHATEQYKQPGSSIKPIIDYVLAFENLGWATDHVLVDKPINYAGTNIIIGNSDGIYRGEVTLSDCIGHSLNTTAIQTLTQVVNKVGVVNVVEYLNNMGYDQATVENFNIQWGIGGSDFTVSCKQMASALAALLNKGQHIEPHTITKIEFANGKAPIEPIYAPVQAVSEQASYLMSQLLYKNVNGGYANLMNIISEKDYAVYGKTGTTDWGTSGRDFNIPDGAIKDGWVIGGTNNYSVATWVGYEKASKDEPSYMTMEEYLKCIKEKITNLVLDSTVQAFGTPSAKMERPEGISTITHIISTYPYVSPIEGMDEKFITTGEIITKFAELVSPDSVTIEGIGDNCEISYDVNGFIGLKWPEYPNKDKLSVAPEEMDLTLDVDGANKGARGRRLFDYSWVYGAVRYKANITVKDASGAIKGTKSVGSDTNSFSTNELGLQPGDKVDVDFFYGYDNKGINSNVVTKSYQVVDNTKTINNLKTASSLDDVKLWAKQNGIPEANIEVKTITSGHSENSVEVLVDNTVQTAETFTVKESQLKKVKILYYKNAVPTITLTSDKQTLTTSETVSFTATIQNLESGNVEFTCPGIDALPRTEPISNGKVVLPLSLLQPGQYTITATIVGKGISSTCNITVTSPVPTPTQYTVTATSNDPELGTVSVDKDTVNAGEKVTVTANPKDDTIGVKNWGVTCEEGSSENACILTVNDNINITVEFGVKNH